MVARHHGRFFSMEYLRGLTAQYRGGVSVSDLADAAGALGFQPLAAELTGQQLTQEVPLPVIVPWGEDHFVVVYKASGGYVWIADPAAGKRRISFAELQTHWSEQTDGGVALMMETTPDFFEHQAGSEKRPGAWRPMKGYFSRFKSLVWQLGAAVALSVVLQLAFPFILQAIVDYGIARDNLDLIRVLILAHLLVFIGRLSVDILRDWLVLHIGERVNIHVMSDFLSRLLRMPMQFFESRQRSDLFRRLSDSGHLEQLFRRTFMVAAISLGQILVFAVVLAIYSPLILLTFLVGVGGFTVWTMLWWQKRTGLANQMDSGTADAGSQVEEILEGMSDLRNYGAGQALRWKWEQSQTGLFQMRVQARRLEQWQHSGGAVIEEATLLAILYLASTQVVAGSLTLGMLLAIMSIIGQLSSPVRQLLHFIQQFREAGVRIERMREILRRDPAAEGAKVDLLPENAGIYFEDVGFAYGNGSRSKVLDGMRADIPFGKRTAITGESGAGKSTFLRLLVNHYAPTAGRIRLEEVDLSTLREEVWQQKCGIVLDDSRLFSDSVFRNITLGAAQIEADRLAQAVQLTHLQPLIDGLPMGLHTPVGNGGAGLSKGEIQQILLARLAYARPDYVFLDEATTALDPFREMMIWDGLCDHLSGKTMVFATRQPNALKTADHILVLRDGVVVEQGSHEELLASDGFYTFIYRSQLV
jgi:ATP-binding cassette subfamily B protein